MTNPIQSELWHHDRSLPRREQRQDRPSQLSPPFGLSHPITRPKGRHRPHTLDLLVEGKHRVSWLTRFDVECDEKLPAVLFAMGFFRRPSMVADPGNADTRRNGFVNVALLLLRLHASREPLHDWVTCGCWLLLLRFVHSAAQLIPYPTDVPAASHLISLVALLD